MISKFILVKFGLTAIILENSCELSKSKMGKSFYVVGKSFHVQGHLFTPARKSFETINVIKTIETEYIMYCSKNI